MHTRLLIRWKEAEPHGEDVILPPGSTEEEAEPRARAQE